MCTQSSPDSKKHWRFVGKGKGESKGKGNWQRQLAKAKAIGILLAMIVFCSIACARVVNAYQVEYKCTRSDGVAAGGGHGGDGGAAIGGGRKGCTRFSVTSPNQRLACHPIFCYVTQSRQ